MKLTKEMLNTLIAETLNERSYSMDDMYSPAKNLMSPQNTFDTLRRLTDPEQALTDQDFEYLKGNIEAFDTDIQRRLVSIQKSDDASPELKAKVQDVFDTLQSALDAKVQSRQTLTQPQIRSAAGEVAGGFPDELNTIIPAALGTGDFLSKMKKTSEISNVYFKAAGGDKAAIKEITNKDNREFLAEVMLLEYFAEIASSFDAGAGAYLFEYFLAMISGGRVTGKETGPGGGMGAVDFRTADGQGGSAKYYSKSGGVGQAKTGFNLREPVDYVIAIKKQGSEQVGAKTRGTSDPAKMVGADIYYLRVTRVDEDRFQVSALTQAGAVSKKYKTEIVKTAEIDLNKYIDSSSLLGTIFIAETRTKTFRDMIYKSIESDGNQIKQMITKLVETFFTSLDQAGASAKDYAVSGDPDKGSNTMTALNMADNSFSDLRSSLEKTDNVDDQQIAENKEQINEIFDNLPSIKRNISNMSREKALKTLLVIRKAETIPEPKKDLFIALLKKHLGMDFEERTIANAETSYDRYQGLLQRAGKKPMMEALDDLIEATIIEHTKDNSDEDKI
tara:strand:- start:2915 stop:4594 length:1680 start_codon:yes stop_codon:yes gene_type:complete